MSAKTKTEEPVEATEDETALQPAPQINVMCTAPRCSEKNVVKAVDAGTVVGDNVMMYGTLSCMVCGNSVQVVHE